MNSTLTKLINLLVLIVTFVCVIWLYFSHADIAATKNEHLQREIINKVDSLQDIEVVKSEYIGHLKNTEEFRYEHNSEVRVVVFILGVCIILLVLNTVFSVVLNKRLRNAT